MATAGGRRNVGGSALVGDRDHKRPFHAVHAMEGHIRGAPRTDEGGDAMSTYRDSPSQTTGLRSWSRTRWLVLAAIALAIVVAIVMIVLYTGGSGGSSGGGGGY